jgi:hypothetical protein
MMPAAIDAVASTTSGNGRSRESGMIVTFEAAWPNGMSDDADAAVERWPADRGDGSTGRHRTARAQQNQSLGDDWGSWNGSRRAAPVEARRA